MAYRNVLFVINPASGIDYPILSVANRFFNTHHILWTPLVTLGPNTIKDYFKENNLRSFDAILIYGGDGTIMEVVRHLPKDQTPLLIIPGGTANATAKEFKIPLDPLKSLELLLTKNSTLRQIDTYTVNKRHRSLIVSSLGSFSEAIKNTDREMKDRLGFLSYVVNTSKVIFNPNKYRFRVKIDQNEKLISATAVFVCNIGNFGLSGLPLHPDIRPDDGLLDVLILKNASLITLGQLALKNYFELNPDSIIHLTGKNITILGNQPYSTIVDDEFHKFKQANFQIRPHSLKLILPK